MTDLCTKFHVPSSNDSLVTAIKPKDRNRIHAATMFYLAFYKQKKSLNKVAYFWKVYNHTSFQDLILSGASDFLTS